MIDSKTIDNYIWRISSIWHDAGMDGTRYVGVILYIMCLKKMIEENACINPDYMPSIVGLTKVLYRPVSIEEIDVIRQASVILEETYDVRRGLFSDILYKYRSEEESWKKALLKVIAVTSELNLSKEDYHYFAEQLINAVSRDARKSAAEKISSNAVADLLSIAADVKDGEKVLDGTIGYGYSAIKCIKDKKNVTLYGVDINTDSLQVATLYMILCGVKFEVMQEDFTAMDTAYVVDKVVMDIPFGMRPMSDLAGYQRLRADKWMDTDTCKEMECLFMASGLDAMKDNGRFVVIVPQGILFKQSKAVSTFRRNLVKEGLLKAVVALPPVYNSINVNTAILIFEKGNKDVLFVDASSLIQRERRNEAYLTEENKAKLHEILETKLEVEGISFRVSNEEVLATGDWSIAKYVKSEDMVEYRSLEEIDKELSQLYKRLDELSSESNSIEFK